MPVDNRGPAPEIIGFACSYCTFKASEMAGSLRMKYPEGVKLGQVPCSSRVDPAFIIKAIMALGSTTIPLGGDGWGTEQFYERGGKDLRGAYYSTHWAEDFDSPKSMAFVKKFKHGPQAMYAQEALAYDTVYLLADAIRRAGTSDREKVRGAIAATREYTGVTGRLSFLGRRDPNRSAVIMEITAGRAHFFKSVQP